MTKYNRQKLYFSNNLFILREKENLSQEKLAGKFGLTKQAVGHWETGKSKPDVDTLIELAAFFNVSVDTLLFSSNIIADFAKQYDRMNNLELEVSAMREGLAKLDELKQLLVEKKPKKNLGK